MSKFDGFSITHPRDLAIAAGAKERVMAEFNRLNLDSNRRELDERGFTVLTPAQIAPPQFIEDLRSEIIRVMERDNPVTIDLASGIHSRAEVDDTAQKAFGAALVQEKLLSEGRIFEQVLMNEAVLALVTYLLGETCDLSSMTGVLKGKGDAHMEMHVDHMGFAELPPQPLSANATWLLTDYTLENGATCFRPGSHLLRRTPDKNEARDVSLFEPVEAPAGSVVLWGGNTWHGSAPRQSSGLRMSLIVYYARWFYYKDQKDITERVTPEALERNPRRFRRLVGLDYPVLWQPEDPASPTMGRTCHSWFA